MPLPPLPTTEAMQRDHKLAQKLFPHLERLIMGFQAQNPNSAHAIMVAIVHFAASSARQIGMKEDDFITFCRLVFKDRQS